MTQVTFSASAPVAIPLSLEDSEPASTAGSKRQCGNAVAFSAPLQNSVQSVFYKVIYRVSIDITGQTLSFCTLVELGVLNRVAKIFKGLTTHTLEKNLAKQTMLNPRTPAREADFEHCAQFWGGNFQE